MYTEVHDGRRDDIKIDEIHLGLLVNYLNLQGWFNSQMWEHDLWDDLDVTAFL